MKDSLIKIMLMVLLFGMSSHGNAAELFATDLERSITQQLVSQQARVQIQLDWEKEIRMRDVMFRHPRPGVGNPVLQVKQRTTSCQGMLLEGNRRVALPAVCLKEDDFTLKAVHLTFSNQRKASGTGRAVYVQKDIGYVLVKENVTQGLRGIAVASVQEGKTLQEMYGESMTNALHQFFASFGVRFHAVRCRIGRPVARERSRSHLKIGEPVIFKGKLVALVKEVPLWYGSMFGGISESAFAIFRT